MGMEFNYEEYEEKCKEIRVKNGEMLDEDARMAGNLCCL